MADMEMFDEKDLKMLTMACQYGDMFHGMQKEIDSAYERWLETHNRLMFWMDKYEKLFDKYLELKKGVEHHDDV